MKLTHDYRSDGMFLVTTRCLQCSKPFDVLALAPAYQEHTDYCDICCALRSIERTESKGAGSK
jgi:hypothetical protein